jgi:1,4-dihydroxy-2-naphthoyl-CoA synthase
MVQVDQTTGMAESEKTIQQFAPEMLSNSPAAFRALSNMKAHEPL